MSKIIKPTAKIVLMKQKVLKNGEHPVALRVSFNRKSKYFVLKDESKTLTSSLSKWDDVSGRYNRSRDLNIILNEYEARANKVFTKLEDVDFTFSKFEKTYFKSNVRVAVDSFFDNVISDLKLENRLGTADSYRDTQNRVREFTKNRLIYFQDVDLKFIEQFEKHLLTNGNKVTSTGVYLRTFRALINRAIKEDLLDESSYPFKHFSIKSGSTRKRALTKESMKLLFGFKPKKGSREFHSLNYFLFSYFTRGMNLKDLANLTWKESLVDNKLVYVRAKTEKTKSSPETIIIKIEKPIADIISKYPKRAHYIFPILEEGLAESPKRHRIKAALKKISKDITIIAKELKIPEADDITFYWARHTYATVLKRSGVSTAIISEALGHEDEKTTQVYLDKFENDTLDATFDHLL